MKPKATIWFMCFRRLKGVGVERDHGKITRLEDAVALLTPAHVRAGWSVRQETHWTGCANIRVLQVWRARVVDGKVVVEAEEERAA